ncbi:MAG: 30S ribosomal protein S9 [Spirochaetes bacterium]|nr:30S ribosomal protein S9 [Spirochaetota bacterium]
MNIFWSKGSRKTAIARARLVQKGSGKIIINEKDYKDYFPIERYQYEIIKPLKLTNTIGKYDIYINVKGGGPNAQMEAVRHSIARALVKLDEEAYKKVLKSNGLLKRDPRMVERKKYGRKKARKQFQFSKR